MISIQSTNMNGAFARRIRQSPEYHADRGIGTAASVSMANAAESWLTPLPKLKNDRHRRVRGGDAVFLLLSCTKCATPVLLYQKDGSGALRRCYLNRIFAPPELERLQRDPSVRGHHDLKPLSCAGCNAIVGHPMHHHDGRIAFRLIDGAIAKTKIRNSSHVA